MDRARMADYQRMARELRAAGIRAEVFLGGGNMGRQLKYADRRAAPVAVIEGEDEQARGVVQLKDLALGARLAAEIETHEDWAKQPAQVEVPRERLAEAVREMIARAEAGAPPDPRKA
jgi:histidyl-tRNA synthetase